MIPDNDPISVRLREIFRPEVLEHLCPNKLETIRRSLKNGGLLHVVDEVVLKEVTITITNVIRNRE